MIASLIPKENTSTQEIPLKEGKTVLGRGKYLSNEDRRISRNQAEIVVGDKVVIIPLGTNPVYIVKDAEPVNLTRNEECILTDGDVLIFCTEEYTFQVSIKRTNDISMKRDDSDWTPKLKKPLNTNLVVSDEERSNKKARKISQDSSDDDEDTKKYLSRLPVPTTEEKEKKKQELANVLRKSQEDTPESPLADLDNMITHRYKNREEPTTNTKVVEDEEVARRIQEEWNSQPDEEIIVKPSNKQSPSKQKKPIIIEEDDNVESNPSNKKRSKESESLTTNKKPKIEIKEKYPIDDDEALARALQEELEEEEDKKRKEQQKKDEMLAKKMATKNKESSMGSKYYSKMKRPRRRCAQNTNYSELTKVLEDEYGLGSPEDVSDEEEWNSDQEDEDDQSQNDYVDDYEFADTKIPCKYGKNCYQKNPKHRAMFSH